MRVLISVSDKTGLEPFARALVARGCELVSTGGTSRMLSSAGLPVTAIADVTGFPEMLDGRVKTLHPKVHGGILARRSRRDDMESLALHGIKAIDLVVVNLYPFAQAAAKPNLPFDDLVEEIDIGGPSLVRAAAKNFRDVLVVVAPADYEAVLAAINSASGPSLAFRFALAQRAFAHTAAYDRMIADTLAGVRVDGESFLRNVVAPDATAHSATDDDAKGLPDLWAPRAKKIRDLRYGENPHQAGAWYAEATTGFGDAVVHQGKELSFTNLLDLDAAARLALEFDEAAAVVIKHTNPSGVATDSVLARAYERAREADPLSAFGGIVGFNRPIDVDTARALTSTFIEAVVAPSIAPEALAVLATKPNVRVVTASFAGAESSLDMRSILGAFLVQSRDRVIEALHDWPGTDGPRVVTTREPTAEEWRGLRFAWRVCAHVKSNTVVFAATDVTLAVGAGQMSRVDSVRTAVMKAGDRLKGSVAASDAFFPFRDGLDEIARAGATAIVQPGGSMRDAEVIAAANEHGIAMVFTGRRHFRH